MLKAIKKYLLLFVVVLALLCSVVFSACGDNGNNNNNNNDDQNQEQKDPNDPEDSDNTDDPEDPDDSDESDKLQVGTPKQIVIPASGDSVTVHLGNTVSWDGKYELVIYGTDASSLAQTTITVSNLGQALGTCGGSLTADNTVKINGFTDIQSGLVFTQSGDTAITVEVTLTEVVSDYTIEADNQEVEIYGVEGYTEVEVAFGKSVDDGEEYTLSVQVNEGVTVYVYYGEETYEELALSDYVWETVTITANKSFGLKLVPQESGAYDFFLKLTAPTGGTGDAGSSLANPIECLTVEGTHSAEGLDVAYFSLPSGESGATYSITFDDEGLTVEVIDMFGSASTVYNDDMLEVSMLSNTILRVTVITPGTAVSFTITKEGGAEGPNDGTSDNPREAWFGENNVPNGSELYFTYFNESEETVKFTISFAENYSGEVAIYLYGDDSSYSNQTHFLIASEGGSLEFEIGSYGKIYFTVVNFGGSEIIFTIDAAHDE